MMPTVSREPVKIHLMKMTTIHAPCVQPNGTLGMSVLPPDLRTELLHDNFRTLALTNSWGH